MKVHTKKKQYRLMMKLAAKEGFINLANGRFERRSHAADNSMKRDYSPQEAGR